MHVTPTDLASRFTAASQARLDAVGPIEPSLRDAAAEYQRGSSVVLNPYLWTVALAEALNRRSQSTIDLDLEDTAARADEWLTHALARLRPTRSPGDHESARASLRNLPDHREPRDAVASLLAEPLARYLEWLDERLGAALHRVWFWTPCDATLYRGITDLSHIARDAHTLLLSGWQSWSLSDEIACDFLRYSVGRAPALFRMQLPEGSMGLWMPTLGVRVSEVANQHELLIPGFDATLSQAGTQQVALGDGSSREVMVFDIGFRA